MASLMTDIETALEREPDFYRALVENSEDLIVVVDAAGVLLYASPSVSRTLGYATTPAGTSVWDHVHPGDLARVRREFERTLRRQRTREAVELRLRREDGFWTDVSARASVIVDAENAARVIVNGHDITDRKRAAEEQGLGGSPGADLNNILGAILGNASLALDKLPQDAPARRNVAAILDAVARATELSRRLQPRLD